MDNLREKVIKGLECCLGTNDCDLEPKKDCPYNGMLLCAMALEFDVISLLKAHEPIKAANIQHDVRIGGCPQCGYTLSMFMHYCPKCGQAVKWV